MAITVIVEFQGRPGVRAELASVLDGIMATLKPSVAGLEGSTLYEVLDSPDALVEIAEWSSAEAQEAGVRQAMESGVYGPLSELLAAPPRIPPGAARPPPAQFGPLDFVAGESDSLRRRLQGGELVDVYVSFIVICPCILPCLP